MQFLYDIPALLYHDAVIVGDTHFGIESRLKKQGVHVQHISMQLAEKLADTAKEHNARKIIFLGDVKDDITYIDDITRKVFTKLQKNFEIIIVRGNHDGGIEEIAGLNVAIIPSSGLLFDELGLIHGHAWPDEKLMNADYLVSAHQHPQIALQDSFGKTHVEPVWVVSDADQQKIKKFYKKFNRNIKLVTIPAFNPLIGFSIQKLSQDQLGPLLNNKLFKWNDALVLKLNGSALGKIKNL